MNDRLRRALVADGGPLSGAVIQRLSGVSGGCIHQSWRLWLEDGRSFFAKAGDTSVEAMLAAEAEGLTSLRQWADPALLVVPEPLMPVQRFGSDVVLLLPWLDLSAGDQRQLGKGLALLHQASAADHPGRFGWSSDGFIGAGPQPGGWSSSWGEAFVELRLRPQIRLAAGWGLQAEELEPLLQSLGSRLDLHQPLPALIHGDLWGGNAAVLPDSRGVLIDPAVWWADREVDLAMTRMFGGFSRSFYEAYEQVEPLPATAESRVEIYNLYHLINHANLFGGSYQNQTIQSLKYLSSQIL